MLHRAISGNFRQQAILSVLYVRSAGSLPEVFNNFDLLNLPNPDLNKADDALVGDINVMNFLYDDPD